MPRKSYDQLNEDLTVCRKRFLHLSTDPDYNITTWRAKEYVLHDMSEQGYKVVFLVLVQIQDFQKYQAIHGQPGFNRKIRAFCNISDPDIVMRVRCSKSEILFFLEYPPRPGAPAAFDDLPLEGFRTLLRNLGISASVVHKEFNYGDIADDLRTLQAVAQAQKEGYQL